MGYSNNNIKIIKGFQDNIIEQKGEIADLINKKHFLESSLKSNFLLNNKRRIKLKFPVSYLKKKPKRIKIFYILYIKSSLRGFHINISDKFGKVLKVFTLGKVGFKKAQRYNRFSLILLANKVLGALKILKDCATKNNRKLRLLIFLKNYNSKRQQFIRLFYKKLFVKKLVTSVVDLGDFPYNGCRPKCAKRK